MQASRNTANRMPAKSISRLCALYHAKAAPATKASRMNGGTRMRRHSAVAVLVVMSELPQATIANDVGYHSSARYCTAGCEAWRFRRLPARCQDVTGRDEIGCRRNGCEIREDGGDAV